MQAVSNQATTRLSFAYKLRCPGDAVLNQYNNPSANKYAVSDLCCFEVLDLRQGVSPSLHTSTEIAWHAGTQKE